MLELLMVCFWLIKFPVVVLCIGVVWMVSRYQLSAWDLFAFRSFFANRGVGNSGLWLTDEEVLDS